MWWLQPEQFSAWLGSGQGYAVGALKFYENDRVWKTDPKIQPFRDAVPSAKWVGWPGPPSPNAARAQASYIVVDMFARAASGELQPRRAVEWATKQLEGMYV